MTIKENNTKHMVHIGLVRYLNSLRVLQELVFPLVEVKSNIDYQQ